jgi:RHS repeat-associated protein
MYTGKPYDSATSLYYYGARYYDQTTGRFITQDSHRGNLNDPQSLNRYIYGRDNPEKYIDTNGHMYWGRYCDGYSCGSGSYSYSAAAPTSSVTTCSGSADMCQAKSGQGYGGSGKGCAGSADVCLLKVGVGYGGPTTVIGLTGGGGPTSASFTIQPTEEQKLSELLNRKPDTSHDYCVASVCFNPGLAYAFLGWSEVGRGYAESSAGFVLGPLGLGLYLKGQSDFQSGLNDLATAGQDCSGGCPPIIIDVEPFIGPVPEIPPP